MAIQTWFPTSIYSEVLFADKAANKGASRLKKFNRELRAQSYLIRETDPDGQDWSVQNYANGYTSYGSLTDLHQRNPYFEELRVELDRHARRLSRYLEMDLQDGRLEMSSCWVNIMPTHTVHSLHLHPLSVLSGTYYVDVPKGASSIKFEDPRLAFMMAAPPKLSGARPRNQPFVRLQPTSGQVVLWESWLRHEVPPNPSRQDRVSISFNYDWK